MKNYYEKRSTAENDGEKPDRGAQVFSSIPSYPQSEPVCDFEDINYPARIAVYDDLLSTPRVVTIDPTDVADYLNQITTTTYDLARQQGGDIPYTVIRELVENFIHAYFIEPTVSIMEKGSKIRFTDQGPGIKNIQLAQKVGVTSATREMKKYIRGVGSGLPVVREYLEFVGGVVSIENNIKSGTVVTISTSVDESAAPLSDTPQQKAAEKTVTLSKRESEILILAAELEAVGPTELNDNLKIPVSTGYRDLKQLENRGFLVAGESGDKKRVLTQQGIDYVNSVRRN